MSLTLLLGGARSGKSRRAEELAAAFPGAVVYVATAPRIPGDAEWAARIAAHRARRPQTWRTVEEEVALAAALEREAAPGRLLLVECATTWLANLLHRGLEPEPEVARLVELLPRLPGEQVVVANEVGAGICPENRLARRFRDLAGSMNQGLAAAASRVEWLVAGLPVVVKGEQP
ncbi:MAG: bifunctional adenosylcobinamide kinase/adenosylcobinamide-phosphate guanylyltransferase [Nitrospirae bacterium]|nr:MAG: bifunctional adenosylcobinamide kinase/adenosylcobinamide-phosphate guanylyltransferase [Nitrospirota bacterium]